MTERQRELKEALESIGYEYKNNEIVTSIESCIDFNEDGSIIVWMSDDTRCDLDDFYTEKEEDRVSIYDSGKYWVDTYYRIA